MNRVEVVGGLLRDPSYGTEGGLRRASFTIAVNGARFDPDQRAQVVSTTYVSCEAYGTVASLVAGFNLARGDEVYVVGELTQTSKSEGDRPHTRVGVKFVTVTRKSSSVPASSPPQPGEAPF